MYDVHLRYQCECDNREILHVHVAISDAVATSEELFLLACQLLWEKAQLEIEAHQAKVL